MENTIARQDSWPFGDQYPTEHRAGYAKELTSHFQAKAEQLRAELAHAKTRANKFFAAVLTDACAARDALARECNQLEADREYNAALQTINRDFWFKTCLAAEVEAEGLRQQLAQVGAQTAAAREAVEWLWGFWDGNTLRAIPGSEEDIGEAWNKLLAASDAFSKPCEGHGKTAAKLLERLAILDAAEAALADCGVGGIYAEFNGLTDAIEQMTQYIDELTREDRRRTEQVAALQTERQLRREAEQRAEGALATARKRATQMGEAERRANKAVNQLNRAGKREHQANQRAEMLEQECNRWRGDWESVTAELLNIRERLAILDAAEAALAGCGLTGIYDEFDGLADAIQQMVKQLVQLEGGQALQAERQLRQEAEQRASDFHSTLLGAHRVLDKYLAATETSKDVKTRISWLGQCLEEAEQGAEALAALVTEETAALLERLANDAEYVSTVDEPYRYMTMPDATKARALAARIREALEVNK